MVTELQSSKRRQQLKAELAAVKTPEPQSFQDKVKAFFKYSETILVARSQVAAGLVTAIVGSLDFSPLATLDFTTNFTQRQLIGIGAGIVITGIITEIARRRNADLPA